MRKSSLIRLYSFRVGDEQRRSHDTVSGDRGNANSDITITNVRRYGIGIIDARDTVVQDCEFRCLPSDFVRSSYGSFVRDGDQEELTNGEVELGSLRSTDYENGMPEQTVATSWH